MFRYLFIGILGFTPCCGPGTALQPLIGESTEIHELLETPPSVLEERAPLHAAEQVLASLRSQNNEALWSHLSLKSQAALEARFSEAHQNSRGATLIRAMYDSPMLEKEGTSLEALFFGTQVLCISFLSLLEQGGGGQGVPRAPCGTRPP